MNYLKSLLSFVMVAQSSVNYDHSKNPDASHTDNSPLKVSNAEWKKILPTGIYHIAREQGTEMAYSGKYWDNHAKGIYYCAICGHPLYSSDAKFDSNTGWPSFFKPLDSNSLTLKTDPDGDRTEVSCKRCGSHLGHVFGDGPPPTGQRYCMDGDVLDFEEAK